MSSYVQYHASNEAKTYEIEINDNSMYWAHFAQAITLREGFHRDPVPGSGLDVNFRRDGSSGIVDVLRAGDLFARMSLTRNNDIASANVEFIFSGNQAIEKAASGIMKACALAWAAS